jgi:hypothetical protein
VKKIYIQDRLVSGFKYTPNHTILVRKGKEKNDDERKGRHYPQETPFSSAEVPTSFFIAQVRFIENEKETGYLSKT